MKPFHIYEKSRSKRRISGGVEQKPRDYAVHNARIGANSSALSGNIIWIGSIFLRTGST